MSSCEENPKDFPFLCGPEETDVPFPSPESSAVIMSIFTLSEERINGRNLFYLSMQKWPIEVMEKNKCPLGVGDSVGFFMLFAFWIFFSVRCYVFLHSRFVLHFGKELYKMLFRCSAGKEIGVIVIIFQFQYS
ncbi:hypothetical protein CEXT_195631 [Caerostris extrusa]|uniref:Uncharacterized protein n=1 Tax=Caerostris extrusa TaxID=172846 RepID=A0AAV4P9E7_CAEEX|nr:hypothetical protein CEXT_195631 [Caerostris extrusa]